MMLLPSPSGVAHAQKRKVMNRPYIDQRKFHYGFLAGMHLQDIELEQNGTIDPANGNQWFAETPNYEPGFSVGILGEFFLTKNLGLRIIPTMHFGTKNVTFRNETNGDRLYQTIKSTYITIPVDVKFSAERFNNYRPYIMAGVTPALDLTVKKQKQYLLRNADVYLEAGFGCDFYLPFFKFIPEVKFMYGLSNVINKNRSDITDETQLIFTQSVNRARSKMIVFTFYFE
ncbi:MAG: PorT family protein [Bacteroidaceae bacterium]|nr:PorT family protein [Bacteroidaceae bacterium]